MLKLIIGVKGTGKTKTLISMVNEAVDASHGDVVCIEKGTKLRFDIKYQARLINTEEYYIEDAHALGGFIAGILASNNYITDIFVDSSLKICAGDVDAYAHMLTKLDKIVKDVNLVMSVSIAVDECPDSIKAYA